MAESREVIICRLQRICKPVKLLSNLKSGLAARESKEKLSVGNLLFRRFTPYCIWQLFLIAFVTMRVKLQSESVESVHV